MSVAYSKLCDRCGLKWKQDGPFCRECAKADPAYSRFAAANPGPSRPPPSRVIDRRHEPGRTLIVNGVEFEVTWDGS